VRRIGDASRLDWHQHGADLVVRLGAPLVHGPAHTVAISPTP
jgi:hypothetical protein